MNPCEKPIATDTLAGMARTKSFSLHPYATGQVDLQWENTSVHVKFDGQDVAKLLDGHALRQGWSTALPNGSVLEVRSLRPVLFPELSILVDGRHVDDSPSHPRKLLKASAQGLLIGAALFVAFTVTGRGPTDRFQLAYEILRVVGAILLLRRMYTGLILVGITLLADFILIDLAMILAPSRTLIWPALGSILFGLFYLRAFIALRDLRRLSVHTLH